MATKTQMEKIENVLLKNNTGAGITADAVAALARVPRSAVSKRVSDLREWYTIYSNTRIVDGVKTIFYRLAQ